MFKSISKPRNSFFASDRVASRSSAVSLTTLISVLATAGYASPAAAQAVPPPSTIVSVCSGVSLPRSVVTGIISPVLTGIYNPIQTTVNGTLGALTNPLLPALGLPGPLSVNVSGLLTTAASGGNIGLNVIANDGTLVGPGSTCNATASSFMLNNPAGLAIGGNMISGLGAAGQQASAGEINSIAFGNNATTNLLAAGSIALGRNASVGALGTGSVALGSGSSALVAGSVALGANAVAARGPLTGYTAPLLAGTFNSAGEVSVGAPGAERQITNVAAASALTDAVNLQQLQALAALVPADPVIYDSPTHGSITLTGAGGTVIANLAPGAVTASSTQAVNGSQLYTLSQQVATIGASVPANAVQYTDPTKALVALGGAAGTRITNLTPGAVTALSTDAINGSQLFATNTQVQANTNAITNLNLQVANLGTGAANAVQYDDPTKATITLGGATGTRITNVTPATLSATSTDAVNGSQLFATNGQVATNTAAISTLNTQVQTNTSNITLIQTQLGNLSVAGGSPMQYSNPGTPTASNGGIPTNDVTIVGGAPGPVTVHNVAAGSVAAGSTDAVNGGQLAATNQAVATAQTTATTALGLASNSVQYDNPQHTSVTLNNGGAATTVSNVAAGVAPTDAVNVGQVQSLVNGSMGSAMSQAVSRANAYTDSQIAAMSYDLARARREARTGTASALAAAALPQPTGAGRTMIAGGVGTYAGRTGFAVGASHASDNGRAVFRLGVTYDANEKIGANAGAGFQF